MNTGVVGQFVYEDPDLCFESFSIGDCPEGSASCMRNGVKVPAPMISGSAEKFITLQTKKYSILF